MKMFYGDIPVKAMNVKHYEVDTNDATMVASDLQSGVVGYAKGQKVTGTGKSFEFACYGQLDTNASRYIPTNINIIEICSIIYPVRLLIALGEMKDIDFSHSQQIAEVSIDGVNYPLNVLVTNNILKVACDKTFTMQVFYGKDNYV